MQNYKKKKELDNRNTALVPKSYNLALERLDALAPGSSVIICTVCRETQKIGCHPFFLTNLFSTEKHQNDKHKMPKKKKKTNY